MFSLVYAVVAHPRAYRQPDRLVSLSNANRNGGKYVKFPAWIVDNRRESTAFQSIRSTSSWALSMVLLVSAGPLLEVSRRSLPSTWASAWRTCRVELSESGLNATIVRPWYVLGPGHSLAVSSAVALHYRATLPSTHDSARRLAPVTLREILRTLEAAVEDPPSGVRVVEAPQIRNSSAAR